MRHIRVIIRRDSNTIHNRTVAEWEIPMLEYLFGEEGQIEVTEDFVPTSVDYPSAKEEFERLKTAYGSERKTGVPHVQTVFGPGRQGVRELEGVMRKAQEAEEAAKPRRRRLIGQRAYRGVTDPMLA
jgi:hypothetical protein